MQPGSLRDSAANGVMRSRSVSAFSGLDTISAMTKYSLSAAFAVAAAVRKAVKSQTPFRLDSEDVGRCLARRSPSSAVPDRRHDFGLPHKPDDPVFRKP